MLIAECFTVTDTHFLARCLIGDKMTFWPLTRRLGDNTYFVRFALNLIAWNHAG